MAVSDKQLNKSIRLANGIDNDGTLMAAAIVPVNIDGTLDTSTYIGNKPPGIFLLNPSALTETKSSNWAQQTIPGQSDPVLQWTSGGPRTVAFQALVTLDTKDYINDKTLSPGKNTDTLSGIKNIIGSIAAKFAKTASVPIQQSIVTEQLSISNYLNYYRSLLYPTYNFENKGNPKIESSPPLVVLLFGKSLTNLPYGEKITSEQDLWVVTNLEIQITKQLPNLAPMEANVTFQLTQYNIRSFSRNRFLR